MGTTIIMAKEPTSRHVYERAQYFLRRRKKTIVRLTATCNPVFTSDGNNDFNMGKTIILAKEPTARHVYEVV
jgi:hypothetical protein